MKNEEAARLLERILDEDGCYLTEAAKKALQKGIYALLDADRSEEEREQALWIPISAMMRFADKVSTVPSCVLVVLTAIY